jgi:hypothetical protein
MYAEWILAKLPITNKYFDIFSDYDKTILAYFKKYA